MRHEDQVMMTGGERVCLPVARMLIIQFEQQRPCTPALAVSG